MIVLKNEFIELKILKKGVTFVSFKTLKDNINIITSYKDIEAYDKDRGPYLGALIGPLAGRTHVNQYGLTLDANNGPNHLHGGFNPLSEVCFDVEENESSAVFTALHLDVYYRIIVRLDKTSVVLELYASPRTSSPINLTNHMYFNLLGENHLDAHRIKLNADFYSYVNENMLSTNTLMSVTDSVFDLRNGSDLKDILSQDHPQFKRTGHIDHSFKTNELELKAGHKTLNIKATMPYMHLYLANYFDESFVDEHGRLAKNHASIAIEPQYLPNDIDMPFYDETNPYQEKITYTITFDD
ncbi:MAG TPA: aldose epimerase [Erysipelothrix sp.]|nr:aldose epimerase [Erysipelothrix sp.]